MTKYLFILKPLKPFFFGGEKSSFDMAEYFMQSRYFPQQTSALGLVREHILGIADLLGKTRTEIATCNRFIGAASFDGTFNAGAISKIGPVQIVKLSKENLPEDTLYYSNFDLLKLKTRSIAVNVNYGENNNVVKPDLILYDGEPPKIYDGKDHDLIEGRFISGLDISCSFDASAKYDKMLEETLAVKKIAPGGVFIKHVKAGNTKKYDGKDKINKDGFYKQVSYDLNQHYAFAFTIEIDEDKLNKNLAVKNKIMRFGGRASSFSLSVEKGVDMPQFSPNVNGNKLLLLSDALVDNSIYENVTACITGTTTFRHAITSNSEAIYNKRLNKHYNGAKVYGSERKCLLARGSVLISSHMTKTIKGFENSDYQNLGYNQTIQL